MIQDPTKDPYESLRAHEQGGRVNGQVKKGSSDMSHDVSIDWYVQECDDGEIRACPEITTKYSTGRKYVMAPFAYDKQQLQGLINAIKAYEAEIAEEECKEGVSEETFKPPPA